MTKADRALFWVAERLGMTVGQVCREMTAAEFLGWLNLDEVDKGHERQDNFAKLKAMIQAKARK